MNLLWIMTDQHRADCLGFMGHPIIQTPHLDRLAADGVVFDNAFCQSPVCMASRAVLFTGRYPAAVRVRAMGVLPPSETTLPEVLQRHGYRTGAFGKVHLTPELYTLHQLKSDVPTLDLRRFARDGLITPITDDPCKLNYGFQVHDGYEDCLKGRFFDWLRQRAPELADVKPVPFSPEGPGDLLVSPYPSELHPTTFITTRATDYIRSQAGTSPWFTFCSFVAPHHPFEAPADQIARYAAESIPLPERKCGVEARFIPAPASDAIGELQRYPESIRRRIVHHYLASISLIDDNVGRLVEALEATGQMDDTLILFTSDHGEFLGNHDLLRKPSLHYDETLRVPLLIRMPKGRTQPRREAGLVELTDVCPTLLGLLGVSQPPGVQGCDWSEPLVAGGSIGRADIYSDMFDLEPQRFGKRSGPYMAVQTLRTAQWKLNLYPTAGREHGQLFNLAEDPAESCNRYADPECRDVRDELLWRLIHRNHVNTDPLPPLLTQY
jgi:arylsulfatase